MRMGAGEFARRRGLIECDRGERFRPRGQRFKRKAVRALAKRVGAALLIPNGRRVGYRMKDGSVACEKQRFRDESVARAELHRIGRHASHGYVPVRAYHCEWCGGWHLTSKA